MKHPISQPSPPMPAVSTASMPKNRNRAIPAGAIDHPVLSRLMEEVRNEAGIESSYDRVHNRHNRGR